MSARAPRGNRVCTPGRPASIRVHLAAVLLIFAFCKQPGASPGATGTVAGDRFDFALVTGKTKSLRPAFELLSASMSDDEAPPPSLRSIPASSERLVGTMVDGRYVLKREIGRGGICAVFAAEHRYTRRTYALKALLPEYRKHQEARARLLAEARMLGAVVHPNVVEVIDAGMDDGSPFVVMERLRAKSVEALLLARGKLTVHDALVIARFAAAALRATHRARVIHRDVKPGNLLVVRTETGKWVKLIDFGVATGWEEGASDEDDAPPSNVVGTPYYMAPEHLGGRRVTPAADVYAFGATVYELLTGQVPFAGSFEQVYARAVTAPRPDVRKLRPDAPGSLAGLVACCLAADPRDRFPTGTELVAALDAIAERTENPTPRRPRSPPRAAVTCASPTARQSR